MTILLWPVSVDARNILPVPVAVQWFHKQFTRTLTGRIVLQKCQNDHGSSYIGNFEELKEFEEKPSILMSLKSCHVSSC